MAIDVARIAFAQREYRTAKSEDLTVQNKHPLATELTYTTFLSQQADATTFGGMVLSLLKLDRFNWRIVVRREGSNFSLGDTVTVMFPRYGLDNGENFIVKRIRDDFSTPYLEVILYGPEDTTPANYAPTPPVNTIAPVITGSSSYSSSSVTTLTIVNPGTWSGLPTGYAYQWQRDGVNIAGQTGGSYTLQAADVGTSIRLRVTASNGSGSSAANSNAIGPIILVVTGSAPTNITPPTINGAAPVNLTIPEIA